MTYNCAGCREFMQPEDRVVGVEHAQGTPTQQDPTASHWGGKRSLVHEREWRGDTATAREYRRGTLAELTRAR
jgi:hypothetical protein